MRSPLSDVHEVHLSVAEAVALVLAATHAVRGGFDEGGDLLEDAVNTVLDHCSIDCEFDGDGGMSLTYTGGMCEQCCHNEEDE